MFESRCQLKLKCPFFLFSTGEWKARFDPRFTSRGVFYLDDKHMVDVEVMEDAKHPLSLYIDSELEAQVQYNFKHPVVITVPKIHLPFIKPVTQKDT